MPDQNLFALSNLFFPENTRPLYRINSLRLCSKNHGHPPLMWPGRLLTTRPEFRFNTLKHKSVTNCYKKLQLCKIPKTIKKSNKWLQVFSKVLQILLQKVTDSVSIVSGPERFNTVKCESFCKIVTNNYKK